MSDSDASHRSSPSAGRMRTHRERRRNGLRMVPFEIRESEVDELVRRKLLDPTQRHDRWQIAHALGKLLDRVLARVLAPDDHGEQLSTHVPHARTRRG